MLIGDLAPVLAFVSKPRKDPPNFEAFGLSPGTGWFLFGVVLCLVVYFTTHRETWRRLWLRMDDPRPMAIFRIVFGLCTLCNINGLWEHLEFLFTDEGIFFNDVAQHVRAKRQFAGYGAGMEPGEPTGFFGWAGFWEWAKGNNYSPLLFKSTPAFFWSYFLIWQAAMIMLIVGFQTKWVKWIAWFMFHGIILRNTLFWEGTENVYRCFFFYLCLSRCGQAWSVDNWLRCRKLRREKRLSEVDGPGGGAGVVPSEEHPKGLAAIYRRIPAWPRMLVVWQVGVIYLTTGVLKNGPVWNRGDAMYYAFNLDHFYRLPPQNLSAMFGTTLFRLNTWITHYWEAFFPIVLLSLVVRFHLRQKMAPPPRWLLQVRRWSLLLAAACFLGMMEYAYPVHYRAPEGGFSFGPWTFTEAECLPLVQWTVAIAVPIGVAGFVMGYRWLAARPPTARVNLERVCAWFGRRLWLTLGLIFHIHLILLMNIGWFTPGLVAGYLCFLNGEEMAALTKALKRFATRLGLPIPARWKEDRPYIPLENPRLPHLHRDDLRFPEAGMWTAIAMAVVGVVRRVQTEPDMWEKFGNIARDKAKIDLPPDLVAQYPTVGFGWFILAIFTFAATVAFRQKRGFAFNAWFGPVIVGAAWLHTMLYERDVLPMFTMLGTVALLSVLATRNKREGAEPKLADIDEATGRTQAPWAYGPVGRAIVGSITVLHLMAVGIWILPEKNSLDTFRNKAREGFEPWLRKSQTTQGWGMFAPNPPRSNVFLRVLITDTDGEVYDLHSDVYACFQEGASAEICDHVYPIPWIWYSRQRKMNRRIAGSEGGKGSWYQKWYSRYHCRSWALEHEGQIPKRVELIKVSYPIPSPEKVWKNGAYNSAEQFNKHGKETSLHKENCMGGQGAQLPDWLRERKGLAPATDDDPHYVQFRKDRCRKWSKKMIAEARANGETVEDDDPRFDFCPEMTAIAEQAKADRAKRKKEAVERRKQRNTSKKKDKGEDATEKISVTPSD